MYVYGLAININEGNFGNRSKMQASPFQFDCKFAPPLSTPSMRTLRVSLLHQPASHTALGRISLNTGRLAYIIECQHCVSFQRFSNQLHSTSCSDCHDHSTSCFSSERNGAVMLDTHGNVLSQLLVHSKQPQQTLLVALTRHVDDRPYFAWIGPHMPSADTMWPI